MKAKFIYETIGFKRNLDPKNALEINKSVISTKIKALLNEDKQTQKDLKSVLITPTALKLDSYGLSGTIRIKQYFLDLLKEQNLSRIIDIAQLIQYQ